MGGLWLVLRRSLRHRPTRLVLTAVAVMLGTSALLSSQIVLSRLVAAASASAADRAGKSELDVRVGNGGEITAAQLHQIEATTGVAQAVPLLFKRVTALPTTTSLTGPVVSVIAEHHGTVALRAVSLASGRLPKEGSGREIAIDQMVAKALSTPGHPVTLGSTVALQTATGPDSFVVVGLVSSIGGGSGFVSAPVVVSETSINSAFALNLRAPLVALKLKPGDLADGVAGQLRRSLGPGVIIVDPRDGGTVGLGQVNALVDFVAALALALGATVVANSVAFDTSERRAELSLLRAAGASSRAVLKLLLAEVGVIAIGASALGMIAGIGLGSALSSASTAGSSATNPPLSWIAVVASGAIGLLSAVAGALVPAYLASKANLMAGLHPVPRAVTRRRRKIPLLLAPAACVLALICFVEGGSLTVAFGIALILAAAITGLPLVAPLVIQMVATVLRPLLVESRVAAVKVNKQRNRTAFTQTGLVISTAVTVAIAALASSALTSSDVWLSRLFVGNNVITSPVTEPESIAKAVSDTHQFSSVTTLRIMSIPVGNDTVGVAVIDPQVYSKNGGLDITMPSRTTAFAGLSNQGSVLIPTLLAQSNGWTVGSKLTAHANGQTQTLKVVGLVTHGFPAGEDRETMIMGKQSALAVFGSVADGFDDLEVTTSNPAIAVSIANRYGLAATPVSDIQRAARDAVQRPLGLLQSLSIVAVAIAMLATINTIFLNIRVGLRELALLRAVGLSRRRARSLVISEATLLSVSGILIGLGVGALIAAPLLSLGSTPTFSLDYAFPSGAALTLISVVIAITLTISTFPARRAAGTSIVAALRHE